MIQLANHEARFHAYIGRKIRNRRRLVKTLDATIAVARAGMTFLIGYLLAQVWKAL